MALALVAPAAVAREVLLLDLSVNGRAVDGIVTAEVTDDGRILVPAAAWRAARLRSPAAPEHLFDGAEGFALDAVRGMQWTLDRNGLRLDLQAPADAFERSAMSLRGASPMASTTSARGLYLDYDAFASADSTGAPEAGVVGEFVAFGAVGALVHGQAWRHDAAGTSSVRLETFFQRDLPGRMETLVLGDAVTSAGGWSRPARYAGVRFARDFSTAPDFVTWPVPTLASSAALPSTVDLLVNQQRQARQAVPAGPFELTDVPLGNGAGDLQLVVHDLLGRETVVQQSYYVAPGLLAVGLSDFSHEAGWLRRGFGSDHDRYSEAFAASGYRRGVTDALTLGGRVEWQRERQAAGLQAGWRVGTLGVVGGSLAYSRGNEVDGWRREASAQRISRQGGVGLRWSRADAGYRDFGSLEDSHRTREEVQLSFGRRIGDHLSLGGHAIRRSTWDGGNFRITGVDVSVSLARGGVFSFDASHERTQGWAAGLRVSLPLGARRQALARVAGRRDGEAQSLVEVRQGLPAGPGWGWRVAASSDDAQRLQADLARRGSRGEWSVETRLGPGRAAVRLGARGALGRVGGMGFASRRIDRGAFALVRVGDVPGVAVSLSHQVVARTDAHGRALVTGLLPYQANHLSIDPAQLPLDTSIAGDRAQLVPFARSGSVLAFPVQRRRDDWLVLRTADGRDVPEGARIRLGPGLAEFTVARRGEAYVSGLQDGAQLQVDWLQGHCRVRIEGRLLAAPGMRSAPLVCRGDTP